MWGDSNGSVFVIVFEARPMMTSINPRRAENMRDLILLSAIVSGQTPLLRGYSLRHVHRDVVLQIRYSPRLDCTISVCRHAPTAIFIGDAVRKTTHNVFEVHKGVLAFDYCNRANLIVTGGVDALLRVWDPHMPARPVSILHGHQSHIIIVYVDSRRENIISVARNKDVRVHDLYTLACTQFVHHMHVPDMGRGAVIGATYNPYRRSLLFASTVVFVLELHAKDRARNRLISHQHPVCGALYNSLYRQVVSSDDQANVYVWPLATGVSVMQFNVAPNAERRGRLGVQLSPGVTSMAFDSSLRLLVTGACDGHVRMWNFSNGQCVREFGRQTAQRVTSLACLDRDVIAAGWNHQVTVYDFDIKSCGRDLARAPSTCRTLAPAHCDDILSMDFYPPNMLATSSYDGRIFVWSLKASQLLFTYRVEDVEFPDPLVRSLMQRHAQERVALDAKEGGRPRRGGPRGTARPWVPRRALHPPPDDMQRCHTSVNVPSRVRRDSDGGDVVEVTARPTDARRLGTAVEKLLFLRSRPADPATAALLAACADGVVRAWSARFDRGLLGQFAAAHCPGDAVVAMVTTANDELLVTGDTGGYVKVWDISHYATNGRRCSVTEHEARAGRWQPFAAFLHWLDIVEGVGKLATVFPCMAARGPGQPHLLLSYRAHADGVNSVDYFRNDGSELVVTASIDCSVRLWTLAGEFLGIFGQPYLWTYPQTMGRRGLDDVDKYYEYMLPPDVRAVASCTTLRVLRGFARTHWARIVTFVRMANHFKSLLIVVKHRTFMLENADCRRRTPSPYLITEQQDAEVDSSDGSSSDGGGDRSLSDTASDASDHTTASHASHSSTPRSFRSATRRTSAAIPPPSNLMDIVQALGSNAASVVQLKEPSTATFTSFATFTGHCEHVWKNYRKVRHHQLVPKIHVPIGNQVRLRHLLCLSIVKTSNHSKVSPRKV